MPKKAAKKEVKVLAGVGEVSFLVGILLAVVSVFLPAIHPTILRSVLIVLGFLVGILNVKREEATDFLLASLVIMLPGLTVGELTLPQPIGSILANIAVFVWPAALIVSLVTVWRLASKR